MSTPAEAPLHEYGEQYFQNYNYADRPLGKFSMYWFARRYYARLVRHYAPKQRVTNRLLEMGSGLGHLLGLLEDDFKCVGFDIALYAAKQTQQNTRKTSAMVASADQLQVFADRSFDAVVGLHLVEHLVDPQSAIREVNRMLVDGGLFLFATPNPGYSLRPLKHIEKTPDAISKDPTHINVHPPETWHKWAEESGFRVLKQFGDGLWDVPYLPLIPSPVQFAMFGWPSLIQVMTGGALIPTSLGVNQIVIARKERSL